MLRNWWLKPEKPRLVEDMLAVVGMTKNADTLVLKDGHLAAVLQVSGKDYTGMDEGLLATLHKARNEAIKNMPPNVIATAHIRRVKSADKSAIGDQTGGIAAAIDKKWSSRFAFSYRTSHYLAITTTNGGALDELAALSAYGRDKAVRAENALEEALRDLKSRLSDYNPRRLVGGELCSFIATHLNGKPTTQRQVNPFDNLLSGADLVFPIGKPYQVFEGAQTRYAAWLSIKSYEDATTAKMVDELFRLQIEMTLYAQWSAIARDKAFSIITDKQKNSLNWSRYGAETDLEFNEAVQRIENKEVALCYFAYCVQVFADSLDTLEANIETIETIVKYYGYQTVRERGNIEPLFWSLLPGQERLMVRKRYLTSENAADIATFATVGEGFDRCSWGDSSVTRFLTDANTVFRFCFHDSEGDRALGHTLVFAPSNSGKTTVIDFLLSQAIARFPKLRVILFDRLQGQRVFCALHDAAYSDLGTDMQTNPFQLPDQPACRAFLARFIADMVGGEDDNPAIEKAVDIIYASLDKEQRSLNEGISAFSPASDDEVNLVALLKPFVEGGRYAQYLNAPKDNLDFSASRIVGFNVDRLIDEPKMLGLMLNYIFFRIQMMTKPSEDSEPTPHIIFADELPKLLESDAFARRVKESILEARKLDGVFIGAAQTPQAITNHPIGKTILGSIANFIFFPDPLADEKALLNDYQLSETEIAWIKTSGEFRKILLKRNGGESVILNVDLAPLGDYLRGFNSGSNAVGRALRLQKSGKPNWKKEFLCGEN